MPIFNPRDVEIDYGDGVIYTTNSTSTYVLGQSPDLQIDGDLKLSERAIASIRKALDYQDVVVKCGHCGQWAAVKTACKHCGAPVG